MRFPAARAALEQARRYAPLDAEMANEERAIADLELEQRRLPPVGP